MKQILILALIVMASAGGARRQTAHRPKPAFTATPGIASPQRDALGARVHVAGKELTTLVGEYSDEMGRRQPAQVLHQLPNLVLLRGFANRELKFDGSRQPLGLSATDAALLETFGSDVAEGMLAALLQGAAVRLLGRGFQPLAGPRYDIYEVTAPALGADAAIRKKFYYFDTDSGLLLTTRYHDFSVTPARRIETRFSDWRSVDGSAYPGRIDRYENGRRVASFAATAASGEPAVDVANFR